MTSRPPLTQRNLRSAVSHSITETRVLYILVMGLTGAGKSTFISIVTEDDTIPVGASLESVTQNVAEYILYHTYKDIHYEIHLIDTPGFDDGAYIDHEVLQKIATYINTIYKLGEAIAGIIYLYDITRSRMGGAGERNIRMLEQMVGVDKWDNCTLVTTKWNCSKKEDELEREHALKTKPRYWKEMLESSHQASMERFMKSKGSALKIIMPHLKKKFAPAISVQMDPQGENLTLGETDAGRIVGDNVEKLLETEGRLHDLEAARGILQQKFDEKLLAEFIRKRDKLMQQKNLHRVSRWTIRMALIGGCITATVFTAGPGAATFVIPGMYEKYVARSQKREERVQLDILQHEYKAASNDSPSLSGTDSAWLLDKKVKGLKELTSEGYASSSGSTSSLGNYGHAHSTSQKN
ncbi:hypothetical protein MMC30_004090 [Trapelia coarctata]|nr:hypothetical protein [Trapelia coarctata]